jgi:SSS family solute:Na+ symporter
MVFLIVLVLIYTVLGGMISVVIADYVQFVVLSISLIGITIMIFSRLGLKHIILTIRETMGTAGFDPTVSENGFGWEYIVWMFFLGIVACAIWPTAVARALSMGNAGLVKKQYMFTSVSYLIRFLIPYFWGISAFVFIMNEPSYKDFFFPGGYPPKENLAGGSEAVDNLYGMPFFLGKILPAGVIGLVTAGMLAAFMSTHDSYLLCWSTSLTQDVVAPIARAAGKPLNSKMKVFLSRIFIVLIGGFVLYWGLFYKGSEDIWDYMAVTGAVYFTGAFALLLGGLYWNRASSTGAFIALLGGLGAIAGLSPVQEFLGIEVTGARVGLASVIGTIILLVAGSLLFPDCQKKLT